MSGQSVGRSLTIKQLGLVGLTAVLGFYAYLAMRGLEVSAGTSTAALGAVQDAETHVLFATIGIVVLMTAICVFVASSVATPLRSLAMSVEQMAAGNNGVSVPEEHRQDEIGAVARGLRVLRDALAARELRAAPSADEAAELRMRSLRDRVDTFAGDLVAHIGRLGGMTKRLSEASAQISAAVDHVNKGSDQATAASSHAAGDVSSVATASEQLLDSIEEISRQVVQSTNVVKAAVEGAVETNSGMGRLSAAAQKVGDVVSLISRIAAQTNLLALNATIEAARAGEAGRGFAVVAQEVKTLATQTAKATQDITGQIAEMQEATDLSVDAIAKIQKKIAEVEHISTIIASAVHEQGAATQEIARNVRSAAAGTATMSNHIENVVRSIDETSTSAVSMSSLARELEEVAAGVTGMVGAFTRSLNAA